MKRNLFILFFCCWCFFNKLKSDDIQSISLVYSTSPSTYKAYGMDWHPSGSYLVVGNIDSTVNNFLYKLDGDSLVLLFTFAESGETRSVAWSPDGNYLVIANQNGVNRLYKFENESLTLLQSFGESVGNNADSFSVDWHPDGNFLAVGSYYGQNFVYSFNSEVLTELCSSQESDPTYFVSWNPAGNYLAVANTVNTINRIYPFDGRTFGSSIDTIEAEATYCMVWHPSGAYIFAGNDTLASRLYKFINGQITTIDILTDQAADSTYFADWSPDSKYLAISNWNSEPNRVYKLENEELSLVFTTSENDNSRPILWSPNGNYIAVANYSSSTRLYKVSSNLFKFILNADPHRGYWTYDPNVRIWNFDIKDGQLTQMLNDINSDSCIKTVIIAGDLTNHSTQIDFDDYKTNMEIPLEQALDGKIYVCLGNHDLEDADEESLIFSHVLNKYKNDDALYNCLSPALSVAKKSYVTPSVPVSIRNKCDIFYTFKLGDITFVSCGLYPDMMYKKTIDSLGNEIIESDWSYLEDFLYKNFIKYEKLDEPIVLFFHYNIIGDFSDWWPQDHKDKLLRVVKNFKNLIICTGHLHKNGSSVDDGSYTYMWGDVTPVVSLAGEHYSIVSWDGSNYSFVFKDQYGNIATWEDLIFQG